MIELADIQSAATRIAGHIHRTPVLTCKRLNQLTSARLYFKCENFQKTGSFKFRGACNSVLSLDDAAAERGVATHSSGNHGAALALAARNRGIPAYIVVPGNANPGKLQAISAYGGHITFCEPGMAARESTVQTVLESTGATLIHPFDTPAVIAGQGTAALELLSEQPALDSVLVPLGGGGLASGTVIACNALTPATRVYGVEPAGADDAQRSLRAGRIIAVNPHTLADGLQATIGDLTFRIVRKGISDIVTVSEDAIAEAMRLVFQSMKIVIEPSAAVPLAALLSNRIDGHGQDIGIILSGGNANLEKLPW